MWKPFSRDVYLPPVQTALQPDLEASDSIDIEASGFSIGAKQWEGRSDCLYWTSACASTDRSTIGSGRKDIDGATGSSSPAGHNNGGGLSKQLAWLLPTFLWRRPGPLLEFSPVWEGAMDGIQFVCYNWERERLSWSLCWWGASCCTCTGPGLLTWG